MVKVDNFLYILLSRGPRPAGEHLYYTSSVAPAGAHKISTDIRPMLLPFLHGGQNFPNFGPNFHHDRFRTAVFLKSGALSEIQNKLIEAQRQAYHHTKLGIGGSPNSQNRWRSGYPKRLKVENFLYILRSSGARRVQRRQCHTTCCGRSCCKKTTMPYLPVRPLHFTGGQKSAAPTRVNLGPPHISETLELEG